MTDTNTNELWAAIEKAIVAMETTGYNAPGEVEKATSKIIDLIDRQTAEAVRAARIGELEYLIAQQIDVGKLIPLKTVVERKAELEEADG